MKQSIENILMWLGFYSVKHICYGVKIPNWCIGGVSNCTYLFFRADGFYQLELKNDEDAIANAECNKGTLQVQDTKGRIVWAYSC